MQLYTFYECKTVFILFLKQQTALHPMFHSAKIIQRTQSAKTRVISNSIKNFSMVSCSNKVVITEAQTTEYFPFIMSQIRLYFSTFSTVYFVESETKCI
jgi:hypothetical protein